MIHPIYKHLFWLATLLSFFPWLSAAEDDDPLVAKVNDWPIHLSYVYEKVEELALGDQIDVRMEIDRFIDSVVQEEVMFQYALTTNFKNEPELRQKLKSQVLEYLIQKHITSQIKVTEAMVAEYYQTNLSQIRGEHVRARHIQMKTKVECDQLKPQIDSEATFAELAKKYTIDPELAERGGDLGYLMRHFNIFGFEAQLFDLPMNTVHSFETETGCHLIWITEHLKPDPPPLAEIQNDIRSVLEREQEIELLQAFLKKASDHVTVEKME